MVETLPHGRSINIYFDPSEEFEHFYHFINCKIHHQLPTMHLPLSIFFFLPLAISAAPDREFCITNSVVIGKLRLDVGAALFAHPISYSQRRPGAPRNNISQLDFGSSFYFRTAIVTEKFTNVDHVTKTEVKVRSYNLFTEHYQFRHIYR